MNWVATSYWVVTHIKGLVLLQAISVEDPSTMDLLKEEGVVIVPVTEFSPCQECPVLEKCMGSNWAEGRMGGPLDARLMSTVSTCSGCGKYIFSLIGDPSRQISILCPRQITRGQDCDGCVARVHSWGIN